MPFYERKIESGELVEIEQYYSSGKRAPRGPRIRETPQNQAASNDKKARKEFIRLLYCNFDPAKGDLFLHLTFANDVDRAAAVKAFRNFELRAKRYLGKNKPDVEYKRLASIEQQGKWHIHMIVSGLTLEEVNKLWGLGRVTASILDKYNQYQDLTSYLFKQIKPPKNKPEADSVKTPRCKFAKRWSGTRNLKKPIITKTQIKREGIMRKLPAAPKGCILLPGWSVQSDDYGFPFRRFSYIRLKSISPASKKKRRAP